MDSPRRVLCSSGHSVGKSFLGACLVNWWFDTRESICLTTAPTDRQVKDILWREVRDLRNRANLPNCWTGPKEPRLQASPSHFAHGFTARDATGFQGRHTPGGLLIIFDEAEGVEPDFWRALKSMLDDDSYFIAFYNPTTPGSACHLAEQEADEHHTFKRVTLSCLDHPNIEAQVQGLSPVVPGAITLAQLESMLVEDSQILSPSDAPQPGDIEVAGKRYRPGPIAEARCLGRRPLEGTSGVWSEALWSRVMSLRLDPLAPWPITIGCDVARYGDDTTVIMVRKGFCILHCELHVKLNTTQVARRCRELCEEYKDASNAPRNIPVMIDEGGIGGGVLDQCEGYCFVPVNAACKPRHEARYRNVRSELWFTAREAANKGVLDISRLPHMILSRLKAELMVAKYKLNPLNGKIEVSSKDDMKALLKRSPDLADAFNLCLYPPPHIIMS